jgi:hypothetical protein
MVVSVAYDRAGEVLMDAIQQCMDAGMSVDDFLREAREIWLEARSEQRRADERQWTARVKP